MPGPKSYTKAPEIPNEQNHQPTKYRVVHDSEMMTKQKTKNIRHEMKIQKAIIIDKMRKSL
jgi:hypothetical protein